MKIKNHFLNIQAVIQKYDFADEQRNALISYSEMFSSNEKLVLLAEKYYNMIFESDETLPYLDELKEEDGIEQGMLFAMIYLVRCYVFGEVLTLKGIPEKYAQTAIWHYKDLFQRNYNCYDSYGFSGIYRNGMIQYIKPKTFRIGRLSFEMNSFSGPYTVYQNKNTGKSLPLIKAGLSYLPDGKQAPAKYEGECFITEITENKDSISGYTVHTDGRLNFEQVTLCKEDYVTVLKEGDSVLSVHIPGNEKMTPESVEKSFKDAKIFFEAYYKEIKFKAFVCSSWLLDTGLKKMLKDDSNILKFQQKFKIVLSFVNTFALYWNIFGIEKFIPYSELVPKNNLQRKVLESLNSGENLYSGNGYIMYQDVM